MSMHSLLPSLMTSAPNAANPPNRGLGAQQDLASTEAAEGWCTGVHIAQRHGGVAVVKQSQVPQTSLVGFFHPLNTAFTEMAPFDRLNHGRLALLLNGADFGRVQGTRHAIAL